MNTMIDIGKQISYWRDGSLEDWDVARELVGNKRIRHGMFFVHLAIEKILKAHVCRVTGELAPPIHNLVRLAEMAALDLTPDQRDLLAEINSFNIQARYPDTMGPAPGPEEAEASATDGRGFAMLAQTVVDAVRRFLEAAAAEGIEIEKALVFGSQARGTAHEWSDIDILLVSPQFDDMQTRELTSRVWRLAARIDSRIEPLLCGLRQWHTDDASAIIEIVRREGKEVLPEAA